MTAALGDDLPGVYDEIFDEFAEDGAPIPVPVAKTFSAERAVVTLSVVHPRLRGLPLICSTLFDVFGLTGLPQNAKRARWPHGRST